MNKKTWFLIGIIFAIWICLFPVFVFADNAYYVMPAETCVSSTFNDGSNRYLNIQMHNNKSEVRGVIIKDSDNRMQLYLVSESEFYYAPKNLGSSQACGTSYNKASVGSSGYATYASSTIRASYSLVNSVFPLHDDIKNSTIDSAIYYTFGEGSETEPTPTPIIWGILRDTSYTTRIAGSGQAARRNVDYLSWENTIDANGNDISDCQVEIQAVYGKFTGNTMNDLWETDVQDLAISGSVSLATVNASSGMYSVSWQKVIDDLNRFDFDSLFAHEVNQQIEKNGWYYQIRLLGSDGYIGSWQTLYTPLSMGAKASETIITQNSFDMSVYQVYQDLSTINNNTSITITYIDTDYTINNPNDGTEPEGGTNLWDVLKELISGIFQILAKLGDLVGNLIDGLMGIFQNLFTPTEVDQQINNNINVEVNTYLEESQPGLNQIHNNIDTWKLQLEDIASEYANGGNCIITWEDVSIDLSAFNAGTVTFIPGGTYDLKAAFISLLTAFGISYSTYEMIVSAIIYISLIVLISHKVKGFLKT